MFFNQKLEDCYETVIAALASQIECLQEELDYKQARIDCLQKERDFKNKQIERLKLKLEDAKIKLAENAPQEWTNAFGETVSGNVNRVLLDSDKDPFNGGPLNE